MSMEWQEDYATRIEKIDNQHRQLFRFANKLEAFLEQDDVSQEEIERLLRFLEVYIKSHFQYEEACMLKHGCPVAKKNRDAHLAFLNFFKRSVAEYRQNGYTRSWLESLQIFIELWLKDHICCIDIKLRDYTD